MNDKTILVADDDDSIRELIVAILEIEGFKAVAAANGSEALDTALSIKPDMAILDYRMPDLSGVEVFNELVSKGVHLPILLITAARDGENIAGTSGIKDYIKKPFSIDELLAKVNVIIN